MKSRIYWNRGALESYYSIHDFLFEKWGTKISEEFLEKVDETLASLSEFPKMGAKWSDDQSRRVLIHPHVSLFYDFRDNKVMLLLFWDNRRDPIELNKIFGN